MSRFYPAILGACLSISLGLPALADTLVSKTSPHDVATTVDRLTAAVEGAGANVIARVDHAGAAEKVGLELPPTQALIFGNPALGSLVMQDNPAAGLDLPMRVVVFEDEGGAVQVVYRDPSELRASHDLPSDAEYLKKMTGALGKLTDAAIAAE